MRFLKTEVSTDSFVYDSAQRRNQALYELSEVLIYRNLIFQLIRRDVLTRYKRSVLGVAWTMLNPLGMMLVLTIAFSQIFRFNTPHYPAYVLSGLLVWNFFSQTTTMAIASLVWGGGLLKRIYIPRSTFALSAMGTGLINLIISLVPLLIIMVISGAPVRLSILFLPVPIILLLAFSLGLGLMISTAAIYFPDVADMYHIVLTAWMYLTPIIYPASMLPETARFWLVLFNPMFRLVELFRLPLYDGRLPVWNELWPSVLISFLVLAAGWLVFTKASDEFSYRV